MAGIFEQMKEGIIDTVNPKFKFYNRPLFLAILIGTCTLGVSFALFMNMISQCSDYAEVVPHGDAGFHADAMKVWTNGKPELSCVYSMAYFVKEPQDIKLGTVFCLPPGMQACSAASALSIKTYELQGKVAPKPGDFITCSEAGLESNQAAWQDHLMPVIEFQTCPAVLTTLGSAIGYTGIVELVLTVLFIGALQMVGIIKGKDHSAMKSWILELVKPSTAVDGAGVATNMPI